MLALGGGWVTTMMNLLKHTMGQQGQKNDSNIKKRKQMSEDETEDDNWPRFIVLKCTNPAKNITRISPFLVERSIKAVAGSVKNTKKIKDFLLIECERKAQSNNLLQMNKIGDHDIESSPHRTLNQCKGIIRYRGNDMDDLTDEEICAELKPQGVKSVKRFTTKKENVIVKLNTFLLTFNSTSLPSSIHIGLYNVRVSKYIPNPVRCFQCQRFGHGKSQCKGKEICFRCSEEGHDGLHCNKAIKCFNCGEAHMSSNKECPVYRKEKEIIKIKCEKNISYQEAKQQLSVSGNSLPSGQNTYANVAKRAFTHCEVQTNLTWKEGNDNFTLLPIELSDKVMSPSPRIVRQIEKMRSQSSQSSQTQRPSVPSAGPSTSKPANSSNSSKPNSKPSSESSSEKQKNEKIKKKTKQKNKTQKMDTDSESDTATWGDPMDTLSSDRGRSRSRSPGGRQDRDRTKISPIRPPR